MDLTTGMASAVVHDLEASVCSGAISQMSDRSCRILVGAVRFSCAQSCSGLEFAMANQIRESHRCLKITYKPYRRLTLIS